jgi:hypothetical protein
MFLSQSLKMILPAKHLSLDKSAIGSAALLLRDFAGTPTVSELWDAVSDRGIATFDQFMMGLTFLYLLGAIDHREGRLVRCD